MRGPARLNAKKKGNSMNSLNHSESKAVWIVGGGVLIVLAVLWLAPKSSKPSIAKPTAPNVSSAPGAETTETTALPAAETEESAAQAFLQRVAEATDPRNIAARNTAMEENLDEIEAKINAEVLAETGVDLNLENSLTLEDEWQKQLQMSRKEWEEYQKKPDRSWEASLLGLLKTSETHRADVPEGKEDLFEEKLEIIREGVEKAKESQRRRQELYAMWERINEELTSWMTPAQKEQHEQEKEQRRKAQLKQAIEILQQGGKPPWEEAAEVIRAGKTPKLPINPSPSAP